MIVRRLLIGAGGVALAGVVAVLGLFAGAGQAGAQTEPQATTPAGRVARVSGTITAIQAGGFTLAARNGTTVEVITSASTWFVVVGSDGAHVEGTLADLAVGDKVTVAGTSSGDNKVIARLVSEDLDGDFGPGRRGGHGPRGAGLNHFQVTVKSIAGATITATGPNGNVEITVNTDANTLFIKDGFTGLDAIKAGDKVYIVPRLDQFTTRPMPRTDGAQRPPLTAAAVISAGDGEAVAVGVVQSVDSAKITLGLGPRRGQVTTANLDATTAYKEFDATTQAATDATLSDISVGSLVLVYGDKVSGADNTIAAKAVVVLPAFERGPFPDAPGTERSVPHRTPGGRADF